MSVVQIWRSLLEQADLTQEEAATASKRLLAFAHARIPAELPRPKGIKAALRAKPEWTLARLVGPPESPIPIVDPLTGHLSETGVIELLVESQLEDEVAAAYAKVLLEMYDAEAFYGPVWRALGHETPFDLQALASAHWEPALPNLADLTQIIVAQRKSA